jgi:hypothetical protein
MQLCRIIYYLDAPDDERKYRSKYVEQPRNNKLSYTVAFFGHFRILYHDARKHEYQIEILLVRIMVSRPRRQYSSTLEVLKDLK